MAVDSSAGMSVAEAAQAFAQAIQASPEWRRWQEAHSRYDNDPKLRETTARLEQLSRQFRSARAQGKGLFGPGLAEMSRLQAELQQSPLAREREEAAQALVFFLQDTNRVLSEALGVDFAANAVPRGGGCCG